MRTDETTNFSHTKNGAHGLSRRSQTKAEVTRPAGPSAKSFAVPRLGITCFRQAGVCPYTTFLPLKPTQRPTPALIFAVTNPICVVIGNFQVGYIICDRDFVVPKNNTVANGTSLNVS